MKKAHIEILDQHTLRIEKIFNIGAQVSGLSIADDLEEFLSELDDDDLSALWPGIIDDLPDDIDDDDLPGEILGWLRWKRQIGYLVQFGWPVIGEDGRYSWGHYNTKCFYASSPEAAINKAVAWVQSLNSSTEN